MTIDNQLPAAKKRLAILVALSLMLLSLVYYFLISPMGIDLYILLVVSGTALLTYVFIMLQRPYFVHFKDEGADIFIRYMHIHPFVGSRKSVLIPKKQLMKYELLKKGAYFRHELVLYQKTPRGVARYPGIQVSAFDKAGLQKLLAELDKYCSTPLH